MGTKTNPGAFNCYAAALPDEEIFTVLGRDPATPATIRFWIGERARLGKNVTTDDIDRLGQAAQVADNAEEWRARMLDPVGDGVPAWKLPRPRDLDDGPRVCIDPMAQISEETARWIQSNLRAAHRLMRTSVEAGNGRDNFAAHDASRALTEIALFLGVEADEAPVHEVLPETLGYFGDGDEAVRVSRSWLRGLAASCRTSAGVEEDSRADAQCLHVAELLDLAAHSRTIKVEDRVTEPLRSAQIAAERLQAEVRYLELHRLARTLIDITGDCIYEAPQHAAWTALRLFLSRNLPREIIDAKTGGGVIVEARGDMTSHYRAWRGAMSRLAEQAPAAAQEPGDPNPDYSYWLHEIRKIDHCFVTLGYILPEDVPDLPINLVETDAYLNVAGGFCPVCGAPNYGGPRERRIGKHPALGAPYGETRQERVLVDTAPSDLAHAPEVAPHRFSQFIKGEQYAYARGLEVSPQHLPVALDAMARDGWHLLAIFGATDSKNIGFIFERGIPLGQERFSPFELAHGLGGGFGDDRPRRGEDRPELQAFESGRPLDEIRGADDGTGDCGLGRQQEP